MKRLVALGVFTLAGCVTPAPVATQMLAPDGQPMWVISCGSGDVSGMTIGGGDGPLSQLINQQPTLQTCFEKAAEVCAPQQFVLLDQRESLGAARGNYSAGTTYGANPSASYSQDVDRTVYVRCAD